MLTCTHVDDYSFVDIGWYFFDSVLLIPTFDLVVLINCAHLFLPNAYLLGPCLEPSWHFYLLLLDAVEALQLAIG